MSQGPTVLATRRRATCPNCGKPAEPKYRPFCSARCADLDLSRWLGEVYRVPAEDSGLPRGAPDDSDQD